MRIYELVLVLRPSLNEKDRKKFTDTVKEWLKETKVSKEEEWGQKPLAYPIKKEAAGYYHFLQLESENALPAGLEKRILDNDNVLRHLLLRTK